MNDIKLDAPPEIAPPKQASTPSIEVQWPKPAEPTLTTEELAKIKEGKGIDVVSTKGWKIFRDALTELQYADMVDSAEQQVAVLRQKPDKTSEWVKEELARRNNDEASKRLEKLEAQLVQDYALNQLKPVIIHGNKKKLMVSGRGIKRNEQDEPIDRPVTRVYISVETSKSPEAFDALRKKFDDLGIMPEFEIAYNKENFQAESRSKSFEDNTPNCLCIR